MIVQGTHGAVWLVMACLVAFNAAMLALGASGSQILYFGLWFAGDFLLGLLALELIDRARSSHRST